MRAHVQMNNLSSFRDMYFLPRDLDDDSLKRSQSAARDSCPSDCASGDRSGGRRETANCDTSASCGTANGDTGLDIESVTIS